MTGLISGMLEMTPCCAMSTILPLNSHLRGAGYVLLLVEKRDFHRPLRHDRPSVGCWTSQKMPVPSNVFLLITLFSVLPDSIFFPAYCFGRHIQHVTFSKQQESPIFCSTSIKSHHYSQSITQMGASGRTCNANVPFCLHA